MKCRIDYLKSEIKRVDDELIYFSKFTASTDPYVQSLHTYKKQLFDKIIKLVS